MDHLVRFTTDEGREGQHTAETLDDALRFVERLRNSEAISEVRVFRVQEVPISFRTYFKVELAAETEAAARPEVDPEGKPPTPAPTHHAVDPGTDAGGRRLFSRT